MKAMLFAAGLGSRLGPLTANKPKALVEVAGKTMLQHSIEHLIQYGCNYIVINVHHFANQIIDTLSKHHNFGIEIHISDETDLLLETGGGLVKAANHFKGKEPFVAYNVDILSNIDLSRMYAFHRESQSIATLAVRNRESSRYLLFDEQRLLCGWVNKKTGEQKTARPSKQSSEKAFSGIHIIQPELLDYIQQKGKFSITNTYLELAKDHAIRAYGHDNDYWFDVGKPKRLSEADSFFKKLGR